MGASHALLCKGQGRQGIGDVASMLSCEQISPNMRTHACPRHAGARAFARSLLRLAHPPPTSRPPPSLGAADGST